MSTVSANTRGKTAGQPRVKGRFSHKPKKKVAAPAPSPQTSLIEAPAVLGSAPKFPVAEVVSGHDLLKIDHPLMEDFIDVTPRFDNEQRASILLEDWGRVCRRLTREKVDLHGPADVAGWQEWCQGEAARWEGMGDLRAATRFEALAWYTPDTALEAEFLKRRRWQGVESDRSWFRERRFIAGQLDVDVNDLSDLVAEVRAGWDESCDEPPVWFQQAMESSYRGRDAIKAPPSDRASSWALWQVTADPALSAHLERQNRGFVAFDTETTGLDSKADIVDITVVSYAPDGTHLETISTLVKPPPGPDGKVSTGSPEAVAVHGVTPEKVADAPTFEDLAPELHRVMEDKILVAHNILFDYPKVQRHFSRAKHRALGSGPMVDTLRLARYHQPIPEGETSKTFPRTLKAACEREGLGFDDSKAHGAEYDTQKCAELYLHLRSRGLSH